MDNIGIHIKPILDNSSIDETTRKAQDAEQAVDKLISKTNSLQEVTSKRINSFIDQSAIDQDLTMPVSPNMSIADLEGQAQLKAQELNLAREKERYHREQYRQKLQELQSIPSSSGNANHESAWEYATNKTLKKFPKPLKSVDGLVEEIESRIEEDFGNLVSGINRSQRTRKGYLYQSTQNKFHKQLESLTNEAGGWIDDVSGDVGPGVSDKLRRSVNSYSGEIDKMISASNKGSEGFLAMAQKLGAALGIMSLINRSTDAFLFSPMRTEAGIEAKYLTSFDITSPQSNAQQRIMAQLNDVVQRKTLEAQQGAALSSLIGTGIGAGIGAFAGNPVVGGMIGGGIGTLVGKFLTTEAGTENTELQAIIQRRVALAIQEAQNIQSARMPIIGGSIFGAKGLLGYDQGVQRVLGYNNLDPNNIEDITRLEGDIGFYDQFYNRTQNLVNSFSGYFRGATQLRAFGGRVANFQGRTPEEELRLSRAYTELSGGYSNSDIHEIDTLARNTGIDPVRLMQFNRTAQLFNRGTSNANFLAEGVQFTRSLYGDSNSKILDVLNSINNISEQLLNVNKDAKQEQAFVWARIPELLFGKSNAFGQIDKEQGRFVLSELDKLGKPNSDAQLAFNYMAYGEQDIKKFFDRLDRGIKGDERNLPDMLRQLRQAGDKRWMIERSYGIMNPDIRNAVDKLVEEGGAYFRELDLNPDGSPKFDKNKEPIYKDPKWISMDRIMQYDQVATKVLNNSINSGNISKPEITEAYIRDLQKQTAEQWLNQVTETTKRHESLYAAMAKSEKAFDIISKMTNVAFSQMEFQMLRNGLISNDPQLKGLERYFQGEGGHKFLFDEMARSATKGDWYSNMASDKVLQDIREGKVKTEDEADRDFKQWLKLILEKANDNTIQDKESYIGVEVKLHQEGYKKDIRVIQKKADVKRTLQQMPKSNMGYIY